MHQLVPVVVERGVDENGKQRHQRHARGKRVLHLECVATQRDLLGQQLVRQRRRYLLVGNSQQRHRQRVGAERRCACALCVLAQKPRHEVRPSQRAGSHGEDRVALARGVCAYRGKMLMTAIWGSGTQKRNLS